MNLPFQITDYLDTLDDAACDRLMTIQLVPGGKVMRQPGQPGCLVQVARDSSEFAGTTQAWCTFDSICKPRYGTDRTIEVTAAIREYVVTMRGQRVQAQLQDLVMCG